MTDDVQLLLAQDPDEQLPALVRRVYDDRTIATADRGRLRVALAAPWSWPDDELRLRTYQAVAERLEATRPRLQPGEVLLLTVLPEGGAALFRTRTLNERGTYAFVGDAARSQEAALPLAARHLPAVPRAMFLGKPYRPEVSVAYRIGNLLFPAVDGGSVGLAMTLAAASELVGLPVADGLAATACVEADGTLMPVEGLPEKLGILRGSMPGISRVLVSARQANVDELTDRLALPSGYLVPVAHARDAFDACWPDLRFRLEARWATGTAAADDAQDLTAVALDNRVNVATWAPIATAAAWLGDALRGGGREAQALPLTVAERIARRHDGNLDVSLGDTYDDALAAFPGERHDAIAHLVQAAADAVDAHEAVVARFTPEVSGAEVTGSRLRAMGALGRLHAAWGELEAAERWLRRAVDGWLDVIGRPEEASFPVCELLRVLGMRGDGAGVQALLGRHGLRVEGVGGAFFALARGRALAQIGDDRAAIDVLRDDGAFVGAPDHVLHGRARWLAFARSEPVVVPPGVAEQPRDFFLRELHGSILWEDATEARRIPAEARDRRTQLELERLERWLPPSDDPLERARRIFGAWRY